MKYFDHVIILYILYPHDINRKSLYNKTKSIKKVIYSKKVILTGKGA